MSSIGYTPALKDLELEKLREAYDSLKDVVRGIESAQAAIDSKQNYSRPVARRETLKKLPLGL